MYTAITDSTIKISIIGAAGGIGQSLTLLLKTQIHNLIPIGSNKVKKNHIHLALYDINSDAVNGVATDLSHIDTPVSLSSHSPNTENGIKDCLKDTDLIIISAGLPRKPGMTREDLFNKNASIISSLTDSIIEHCDLSKIFILVISNPVNSLVPVITKKFIKFDPTADVERRVMGVTKLDIVRASTFLHQFGINEGFEKRSSIMPSVPVIGGHSGETIIPLFSQSKIHPQLTNEQVDYLTKRVQCGGDEVVKAKNGQGSATLSMALAGYKVVAKFISLLSGQEDIIKAIFYISLLDHTKNEPICPGAKELMDTVDGLDFFSIPLTISAKGVHSIKYWIMDEMNDYEKDELLSACIPKLRENIKTGWDFIQD
ncbi:hypothetical protein Kpol_1020p28 [Vanderwaltozyma polyspora DSM 70294]|uniref:Malate dehydrogenase n=1 Tax=Vanderwaltozyma polyspora (strain ATCC 22028 / DSM 70294 / BCRC 21397 / CBS 2163 / NBRC 10782 / NRRL Y-8283 / UCD 57-17) TaxID=436907 RepID=A7TLD9_VANPO|nr:uncharacterized protein Kpol_1020p28 [Vanderwaltozyma polyspora DSM 70294]EDO16920.1 hypothetical protein Kpol_1020p28 [Vanderwaltozyma polyspora DSM 70294]